MAASEFILIADGRGGFFMDDYWLGPGDAMGSCSAI